MNPDKVDIWMMGNLIYYMLTDLYTFERPKNLSWKASGRELLAGRRSPLPKHIAESANPSHVAMRKALEMCWTQNWEERPSARSVSDYLIGRLGEITGEEDPDLRVVLPEPIPNMKGTDSEYLRKVQRLKRGCYGTVMISVNSILALRYSCASEYYKCGNADASSLLAVVKKDKYKSAARPILVIRIFLQA